jgi:hypothetical protein
MLSGLVGHDPDVEAGVRLGRRDRLVAGPDEARPQALHVEGRGERHRPLGLDAGAAADERLDAELAADVVEECGRLGVDRGQLRGGRGRPRPRPSMRAGRRAPERASPDEPDAALGSDGGLEWAS